MVSFKEKDARQYFLAYVNLG
ncbi:unnamed protein product [Clonostachys rosea f. rosea IK726]|uniref:Uncharacterized protein n=1 Tax=Clonostachys rosea f. rosea IK726 TaxID=1349383 RepID=A0ACA9TLW6_BIOOC|nr:unnamed protein product [Clonostachys rosea f. rosea IK726]